MFKSKQGFTLIELMVVIVIIGVLASLAIPRFNEASDKAKAADAPRVLASYESAYLAAAAEQGVERLTKDDLMFQVPDSKWFVYTISDAGTNKASVLTAKAQTKIGVLPKDGTLSTTYNSNAGKDCFERATSADEAKDKYFANFIESGCQDKSGG